MVCAWISAALTALATAIQRQCTYAPLIMRDIYSPLLCCVHTKVHIDQFYSRKLSRRSCLLHAVQP